MTGKIKTAFQSMLLPPVFSELEIKMLAGSGWVLLIQLGVQVVGFAKSIVLARLLAPEDFGVFGVALIIYSAMQTIGQLGVSSALIQKPDISNDDLNSAWSLQCLRGAIFALLFLLMAPFLSNYYQETAFNWIMLSMAVTVLAQGLSNIGLVIYQKQIEYRKIFMISLFSLLLDMVVSVYIALVYRSVMALPLGLLINALALTVLSFVIHPFRPRLRFSRAGYRTLLSFGKWIWSGQMIVFLITEGDDILVALMLGPLSLGYYRMAYYLSNLPATQLTNTLGQVSFSAFSKVNSDLYQMRHIFRYALICLGYLTIPLSFGLYLLLPEFVTLVLGESWLPVIPVARILVLWGACRSIGSITGPLFQAVNRPELISWIGLLQLTVMFALLFPLLNGFGLQGVALAVVISGFVQVPVSLAFAHRITRLPWGQLMGSLAKPLIASALMFLLLKELIITYWAIDSLADMVLISCAGCVLYVFLMWLFQYSTLTLKKILPISQPIAY